MMSGCNGSIDGTQDTAWGANYTAGRGVVFWKVGRLCYEASVYVVCGMVFFSG